MRLNKSIVMNGKVPMTTGNVYQDVVGEWTLYLLAFSNDSCLFAHSYILDFSSFYARTPGDLEHYVSIRCDAMLRNGRTFVAFPIK